MREVGIAEERAALDSRYRKGLEATKQRNADHRVRVFEAAVQSRSRVVINVWPSFLAEFLNSERVLFSNYVLQVAGEVRKPASVSDDRQRRGTEGILFGTYAKEIRYGALSLDGLGLISYGSCSVTIADVTAAAKATVLEENSYTFVRHHRIMPGDDIPSGYRAGWKDRHKLAVAKLSNRIRRGTPDDSFPRILLYSDGNLDRDEFLEVHLYGLFDHQAVEAVVAPKPETATKDDRPNLERIRDRVKRNGKKWTER